jgi:hypothetical protein
VGTLSAEIETCNLSVIADAAQRGAVRSLRVVKQIGLELALRTKARHWKFAWIFPTICPLLLMLGSRKMSRDLALIIDSKAQVNTPQEHCQGHRREWQFLYLDLQHRGD